MPELTIDTEIQSDSAYKALNASFGADSLLYNALNEKLEQSGISEASLMEWARFVKLASESVGKVSELEEFAVIKILRSWKSIEGIIRLGKEA